MDTVTIAVLVVIATIIITVILKSRSSPAPSGPNLYIGDVTLDSLLFFCGLDFFRPTLIAVKGNVYDVTDASDQYGIGKPLHKYAGREIARALAKESFDETDFNANLDNLTEAELERLNQATEEISKKFELVGKIVPMKEFTLSQLAAFNGEDPAKPMYLAIKGCVFDITSGKNFYGPNGIYPFAGHECARAFALLSTDVKDCHDDLSGLAKCELETLNEWEAKFQSKYPMIGKIIQEVEVNVKQEEAL